MELIIIFVIIIILYFYFRKTRYWKSRNVQTLPANPIFGNLVDVLLRRIPAYQVFNKAYQESKSKGYKYMGFFLFWKPILIVTDTNVLKHILSKDFKYFTDREFHLNESIDPLSVHLVSLRGSKWKSRRDILSPAFTPLKLKMNFEIISAVGQELLSVLDKASEREEPIDVQDISSKYTVDLLGRQIFGIECNTLKNLNLEFRGFVNRVFGGSAKQNIKFFFNLLCPSVMSILRIPFNEVEVQKFFTKITQETIEYRENNNVIRKDLMQSLIQLRNNINIEKDENSLAESVSSVKALTIEEVAAEALVFTGASYETSVNTATFCIIELLCNHSILTKVKEEIRVVSEKYDSKLTYAALAEMSYLEMCIMETLRKYPQLAFLSRICTQNFQIPDDNLKIEQGTRIYIPVASIHADPEYYPNPAKFDPNRFLPEIKNKRPTYTFLAFGDGPRNCIGLKLGMLQIKLFLALIFKNYNVSIHSKTKSLINLLDFTPVMTLRDKFYLNIEKIE